MISIIQRQQIVAHALAAGFDVCGIAAVPEPGSPSESEQQLRFLHWAEQGFAGEMGWMLRAGEDGVPLRSSLSRSVPWARSVLICGLNYNSDHPRSIDSSPDGSGWIARYAWSGDGDVPTDYHDVMLRRLRDIETYLHAILREEGNAFQTRCYVDTGPVVERWLAQTAGVGWIGKNTCLLNQRQGSWLLLGVVLLSSGLQNEAILEPAADRCGSCTRCLDACPTGALVAPRQMDARKCIAYLTIEKKGSLDTSLMGSMGRQVFGCDICQDVCPWNGRAPIGTSKEMQARSDLVNPTLEGLAALSSAEFKQKFRGSPLERTGRRRLQRNVAIAMGNSGDAGHLDRLRTWAKGDDSMLAEAASWAILRILELSPKRMEDPEAP